MTQYLAKWNIGYGDDYEVVDAANAEEAEQEAYLRWKEAVENSADYSAELFTREIAEDYGIEDELDEEKDND